ncbi:MAG: hypothetical protein ACXVHY_10165 [Methanobacterium sp.]
MKIKKILPILILILGVILISGCTNNPTNQTASSGYFENQFVKFELPAGVTAKDTSNDTSFDIILYKNGNSIGEIDSEVNPQQAIDAIDGYNTTFAGKNAVESNDEFGSQLYIKIRNDTQGNSVGIRISLDPGYSKDYEVIKNSFVIKKAP